MTRRRLDTEMVRRELVQTRAAAQRLISDGVVEVDGNPAPRAATLVDDTSVIAVASEGHGFVSRGGVKLAAALDEFLVDVAGRRAVDVGASTGGFTDCLLQRGARSVVAVDVGYGQLDWRLRNDARVSVVERTNIRHADPETLGAPFDVVVADLSFIGLGLVAPRLAALGGVDSDWIVLVKPQFEAGKAQVGRGGIVRDPAVRAESVLRVAAAFAGVGVNPHGCTGSPIEGAKGNREYLLWLRRDTAQVTEEDLTRSVVDG